MKQQMEAGRTYRLAKVEEVKEQMGYNKPSLAAKIILWTAVIIFLGIVIYGMNELLFLRDLRLFYPY